MDGADAPRDRPYHGDMDSTLRDCDETITLLPFGKMGDRMLARSVWTEGLHRAPRLELLCPPFHDGSRANRRRVVEQLQDALAHSSKGPLLLVVPCCKDWILQLPDVLRVLPTERTHLVVRTPFRWETPLPDPERSILREVSMDCRVSVVVSGQEIQDSLPRGATIQEAFQQADFRIGRVVDDLIAVLHSYRESPTMRPLQGVWGWMGTHPSPRPLWSHLIALRWMLREETMPVAEERLVVRSRVGERDGITRCLRRLGWAPQVPAALPPAPRDAWASVFLPRPWLVDSSSR